MLERAQVTPVDSSTFKVVWKAQDGLATELPAAG